MDLAIAWALAASVPAAARVALPPLELEEELLGVAGVVVAAGAVASLVPTSTTALVAGLTTAVDTTVRETSLPPRVTTL